MKKITFLFALLCASVMGWATQYCETVLTGLNAGETNNQTLTFTASKTGDMETTFTLTSATSTLTGLYQAVFQIAGGGATSTDWSEWSVNNGTLSKVVTWTTYPTSTIQLHLVAYRDNSAGGSDIIGKTIESIDVSSTCGSGNQDPGTGGGSTPEPAANSYTAGGHTITLEAYYVNDIYTLNITSADAMEGLGGSFWFVNGIAKDMRSNDETKSYAVSGDKKTITCTAQSSTAITFDSPLYVLFPGEVNFGKPTLNWEDRTPINSEYCNTVMLSGDNREAAFTWETNEQGSILITISETLGGAADATHFRGNGINIDKIKVGANKEDAANYFNLACGGSAQITLSLKDANNAPAKGTKIYVENKVIEYATSKDGNAWPSLTFEYTYGGICNQLDAPINIAIDADSVITFDAVAGAEKYTAYVYLGGVEKYSQEVASGDVLHFWPLASGDYTVNVIASGEGKTDSDPSADYVWSLEERTIVLGNSEYCEHPFGSGNAAAAITWQTNDAGAIVITISETLGGAADATNFRNTVGLNLNNFKVGAGKVAGSNYFNHSGSTSGNQITLSLKNANNAPALGEKIYYDGYVEYSTSKAGGQWPSLKFEYTYGTVCSGYAVSATPNNSTMGTAVVKKDNEAVTNVEDGDEVSFIATSANTELYRFVNWTKGGVEVSTNATYTTTISETTNLVANFDYIRNTYCHYEILSNESAVQGKKLYMTLGSIGNGQYQIKFEGSAEAPLTALNNANFVINGVATDIEYQTQPMSGNDIPFTKANGRWSFNAAGYGSAQMVFTLAEGKTIDDIFVWGDAIYFATAAGELGYVDNQNRLGLFGNPAPLRHNIDWDAACADAEAPEFVKAEAAVVDASSIRLIIQATDNWEGKLTYTIARANAEPIILYGASGEELTQDVTGLTAGTEYTFTITVSDGVNNIFQNVNVTPVGDNTKPVMGEASLASKTWNSAIINVAATDNMGVYSYYIAELAAEYTASEGQISISGLTQNTAYSFTITAKDAAGNESENNAVVAFTTDVHLTAPTTAAPVPTIPADQVIAFYSDSYTVPATWSYRAPWGGTTAYEQTAISENNMIHYSLLDYVGWYITNGTPYNAMTMEKLHLDIWVENDCTIGIVPIYGGAGLNTDDNRRVKPALIGQQWNSIDLDLATDYAGLNLSSIFQFKYDQATTTEFWLDNVYFYRTTALVDEDAPANVSGSMASQSFFSVVLAVSATDDNNVINYIVKNGDTQVASASGVSGATVNITINNLAAGTDYSFSIIAKDGSDNTAEAITVNASTLAAPAPAPIPADRAADVKALYCDAYTPIVNVANYCEWWWESPTVHTNNTLGEGDHVLFYDNNHQSGASFGWSWSGENKIDFSGYQKLHLSVYPANEGTIEIYPVVQPEAQFHKVSQTLVAGQWNEVVLDYTDKSFAPLNQIGFVNFYGIGEFFIDNVYFFRDKPLVTNVDGWATFASAENFTVPDELTVYSAAYSNEGGEDILTLSDAGKVIPAGTGVLLKGEANTEYPFSYASQADADAVAANFADNSLVGCVTRTDVSAVRAENDIFCMRRSELFDQTAFFLYEGQYVPAGKAYIALPKEPNNANNAARRVRFVINEEQVATGMESIQPSAISTEKFVENGQLFIRRGDAVYTIQGTRVR